MDIPSKQINELLTEMVDKSASDLHISAGTPPIMRIDGALQYLQDAAVSSEAAEQMAEQLLNGSGLNGEGHLRVFRENGEADFAYSLPDGSRFRVNVYRQRNLVSIAARYITATIPTLQQLGLPSIVGSLVNKPQGLILVTGPTGSGKTSTLAAMINLINQTRSKHILTLEDPIEYLYSNDKSLIHQREIGKDSRSFSSALRASLRQDPDVVLIGEMRDLETMSSAITMAETGHLVLATLHTLDAPQSVDRIIDAFPAHQQPQIRSQLASVLVAVISQRLLPRRGAGRACATEILINNPAVANLIRTEKNHQIKNVMQTGRASGMHTLEMCIRDLIGQGIVDASIASEYLSEAGN